MSAAFNPRPLIEYLAQIPDPRVELKCLHDLIDVIMIINCGTIVGADDFVSIAEFARARESFDIVTACRSVDTPGEPTHRGGR